MKESLKKESKLWIRDILIAVVAAFILLQFVSPTVVQGESMANTLHESDYIMIDKYKKEKIEYGDVIVFQTDMLDENNNKKKLIKRVIGLPGDVVEIHNGNVILNNEILSEKYIKDGCTVGEFEATTVPDKKVFVLGDNRQNSSDSRDPSVGLVDNSKIVGKAFFRIYPISGFGGI